MFDILLGCQTGQQYSKWLLTRDLYKVSITFLSLARKTLRTQAATDLPFETILLKWRLQDKLSLTVTPRSLNSLTGLICRPSHAWYNHMSVAKGSSNKHGFLEALCTISSNFCSWSTILFSQNHSITASKNCNTSVSFSVIHLDTRLSSAKNLTTEYSVSFFSPS